MSRATTAVIDMAALRHNLQRARQAAPASRVMAAVKADGYGHGLLRVARALHGADAFAVACTEEALRLRDAGVQAPILLLEGVFEASELRVCAHCCLDLVVHHLSQVEMLERARPDKPLRVWLKIDTGMHRLGFHPHDVNDVWRRLAACPAVSAGIHLMSHLGMADDRGDDYTRGQLQTFRETIRPLRGPRSLANSAAVLGWPDTHFDWVRPGIMLYGASPFINTVAADEGLRPVMTLRTRLTVIKRLRRGDRVGYGGTWTCPEDMDVGLAAIGYGDGYPRHAPSGTPVLVKGHETQLIGRVSMDMICLDLRCHPEARVSDPVVLWGEGLPVEVIARAAGTIPYALVCGVKARVRVLERDGDGE